MGNENGYFLPEEYIDINLANGTILPQMEMYNEDYANTFLCKVEYRGNMKHDAFENEIDSYLPDWMYPKDFMTKQEVKKAIQ